MPPDFTQLDRLRGPLCGLLWAVVASGCAPAGVVAEPGTLASGAAVASVAAGASLQLRLDGLFGPRRLAYVAAAPRLLVTIDGPELAAPLKLNVDMPAAGQPVTIAPVPPGACRIITLQGLDLTGRNVAGATFGVAGTLGPALTTLGVSRASTLNALVVTALLQTDRANGTQVLGQIDLGKLATAVANYTRILLAPDPALMDPVAIATSVYHNDGLPLAVPASNFLLASGKLVLRPTGWPPGEVAIASVDDPLSLPLTLDDDGPHALGPVAPGHWTLTVTPQVPGLASFTAPVVVTSGQQTDVPVSFGNGMVSAALPAPRGAALAGVVPLPNGTGLVLLGGAGSAAQGVTSLTTGVQYGPQGLWTPLDAPAQAVVDAGAAVFEGRLYGFGGEDNNGPRSGVFRVDGYNAGDSGAIGTLPNGRLGWGLAAGAIDNLIYVAGGTSGAAPVGDTLAFDPVTAAWQSTALPPLAPARADLASAVVEDKLYVFGGAVPVGDVFDGSGEITVAGDTQAFSPTPTPAWETLPAMPTPRTGATAVVVNAQIWVIGGADVSGAPSAAVEVYNPAAKSWSIRAPLQTARAFASAGVLDGKIIVAGGVLGPQPLQDVPVAAVEVLTP